MMTMTITAMRRSLLHHLFFNFYFIYIFIGKQSYAQRIRLLRVRMRMYTKRMRMYALCIRPHPSCMRFACITHPSRIVAL